MVVSMSANVKCSLVASKLGAEQTHNNNLLLHRLPASGFKPSFSRSKISTRNRQTQSIITAVSSVEAPGTSQPTTPAASTTDRFTQQDWDDFVKAYTSQYCEHAMFLDSSSVEGTIPQELQGTLLRNGPALYEIGGKKIPQPFDGDGMAALFAFPGNGQPPFVSNRFVRTADYLAEQQAGKMLFRGAFSVGNPSGDGFYNPFDLSIKKVANTGIVAWAGRILALYERDLPYQLAAPDLKTVGRTDCDGAIDGDYFAAHYRILTNEKDDCQNTSPKTRRLIGFNSAESGANNKVTVWEFDEAGKQLHKTSAEFPDAAFAFLHDFAVTEKHYIFLENPVRLNFGKLLTKYMFGKACIAECLQYDTARSTKIHVIPRPGTTAPGAPAVATAPRVYPTSTPFFSFHHVNAFEAPDGRIVVDTVALLDGMDFSANLEIGAGYYADNVGRGTLTRLVVTPWTGQVEQHKLMDRACEFPCVAPAVAGKPHTHAYLVGARMDDAKQWGAPQIVTKVTLSPEVGVSKTTESTAATTAVQKVYNPGPGRWAQEPLFVPRPNGTSEDDGWVLVLVFDSDAKSTELVILDAQEMTVTGKVKLPFFLPAGLHGSWNGEYMGPPAGEEYPAKIYDIRNGASKYE